MNLTGHTINTRYIIQKMLGEGGTSYVYKAKDSINNLLVAIKFMKEKVTTQYIEDIIRFKREIEIINKLNHPNIIKTYNAGEYENKPFLVTEFLEGESLDDILMKGNIPDIKTTAEIMKQLTTALCYVHSKGIIHRDLKPGNVFLVKTDSAIHLKLLDFGISHVLELGEIKDGEEVVGTFGYMSPEATGILNKRVDERSDLYSAGVIFYTLLAGEPPFKEKSVNKLIHQQVALEPPELDKVNKNIPSIIKEIVMKLLLKDPDLRYQSATGLLYDINRYLEGEKHFILGEKDQKVKLTYNTRLVGRKSEVNEIKNLLRKSAEGTGSILLIGGEAGIGKSKLIEEASRYVFNQNKTVFCVRCLDQQNKTPYQIFKDLIDEYIKYLEKLEVSRYTSELATLKNIVGDFNEIIISINPRLEKYLGTPQKIMPLEPDKENQRTLMVLSDFFLKIFSSDNIGFCYFDDLHWADEGSLNLLKEILIKINSYKLLIIGTYRDNEIKSEHGLEHIKIEAEAKGFPLGEIKLFPLSKAELGKLILNLLGEKVDKLDELAAYIFKKTKGNPFFTVNLLRELIERGIIGWHDGSWDIDWKNISTVSVSNDMIEAILKRTGKLSEEQFDLLCKASAIGREVNISLLYKLTDLPIDKVIELMDINLSMQLMDKGSDRGKYLFVHDRIRDAFYQKLDDSKRRSIHLLIAKVIEEESFGNTEKVLFELAHHYVEAAHEDKMLEYIIPAAAKAKSTYANEEAIKYFNMGIGLLDKKGKRGSADWLRCNENLIDVYLTMGKNDESIELAKKLLPFIPESLDKARIYRKLGIAYFKKGDWEKCESNISKGLILLGERLPESNTDLILVLVREFIIHLFHMLFPRYSTGNKPVSPKMEDREIIQCYITLNFMFILSNGKKFICNVLRMLNFSEARLKRSEELGVAISGYASVWSAFAFFKKSHQYHKRALAFREEIGDEWGVAQSLQFIGFAYSWEGKHLESEQHFDSSKVKFSKIGDMWQLGMSVNGLGYVFRYTCEYQKSIEYNLRYLDISQRTNNTYGEISAYIEVAYCLIEIGDFDKAGTNINKALILSKENRIDYLYCCSAICKGYLELETNCFDEAITYLEDAKKLNEHNYFIKDYTVHLYPYLAEAYLNKYQTDDLLSEKQKEVYLHCKLALKRTKPWANHYGTSLRVMAKFYHCIGKNRKVKKLLLKSMDITKEIGRSYELAKSHYELGLYYQSEKVQEKANRNLQKAFDIFKKIDANHYMEKCSILLGYKDNVSHPDTVNPMDRLRMERKLSTILTTSRYLSSILDMDELLEKILDCAVEHVGAGRGALLLYPEGSEKTLEVSVVKNVSKEEIRSEVFLGSRSIISKAEKDKIPLIVSDAIADEALKNNSSVFLNKIRSVMCAPIISKGELLGIIYLDNSLVGGLFSEDDLTVLNLIASQAGVSVENARLYKRLKIYSHELEQSKNEIASWNQTLEQRVTRRTEELEALSHQYKNLADELNEKNIELNTMIEQLKEHAQTVEELAVTKERNRFAMDVHDTLGHSMVLLIKLLEVCKLDLKNNPVKAEDRLKEAINLSREGMTELKRSIFGLVPEKLEANKLITALKKLIEDFKSSDVNINLNVDGIYDYRNPAYSYTLFKVCQEALTNSIRHGKSKNIHIDMKFINDNIKLAISDDGTGCTIIRKGVGLTGMEQRVKELNGTIAFGANEPKGFFVQLELPLEN